MPVYSRRNKPRRCNTGTTRSTKSSSPSGKWRRHQIESVAGAGASHLDALDDAVGLSQPLGCDLGRLVAGGAVQPLVRVLVIHEAEKPGAEVVAHQLLETLWEPGRRLGGHHQVLVLLLAEPAESVVQGEAAARVIGTVSPRAVQRVAGVDEHRADAHFRRRDLLWQWLTVVAPAVASRHQSRRAVVGGEIGHRPHRREHGGRAGILQWVEAGVAMDAPSALARVEVTRATSLASTTTS